MILLIIIVILIPVIMMVYASKNSDEDVNKQRGLQSFSCNSEMVAKCISLGRAGVCTSGGKCCECDDFAGEGCVPKSCTKQHCRGQAKC